MSAISAVVGGADILASWGDAVTDYLNGNQARTAATGSFSTTQTALTSMTVPANTMQAGSTYVFLAHGACTSSAANVVTFRIRIGTTTLTGNIAASNAPTATTTASGDTFIVAGWVTIRATGSSGTAIGALFDIGTSTQPFSSASRAEGTTATVTVNTTVQNLVELTAVTAAGTTTLNIHTAAVFALKP